MEIKIEYPSFYKEWWYDQPWRWAHEDIDTIKNTLNLRIPPTNWQLYSKSSMYFPFYTNNKKKTFIICVETY
jgi:hypothetical protein